MSGMNSGYARLHKAFYQRTTTPEDISAHFRQAGSSRARTSGARQLQQEERRSTGENSLDADHHSIEEERAQNTVSTPWQRELAASRIERRSRASSIVSTRTRLSVISDDARSVEIQAGDLSFRISRDGSKITDVTPPPPYPGLNDVQEEEEASAGHDSESEASDGSPEATPRRISTSGRSRSLEISREDNREQSHEPDGSVIQSGFGIQKRLRNAMSLVLTDAPSSAPNPPNQANHNLRRTQSDSLSYSWLRPWSRGGEASALSNEGASAIKRELAISTEEDEADDLAPQHIAHPEAGGQMYEESEQSSADMATLEDHQIAAISEHYHELMRNIDRDYRKKLHDRDKELAKLRELLNEKDIVYRQQLRERDHTIEAQTTQLHTKDVMINDLKTKFYDLGEQIEAKIEQARNAVEDVWERRWKEHEQLLLRERASKSTRLSSPRRSLSANIGPAEAEVFAAA